MVNIEEFAKRIKQILDYYSLSAASFADEIDVQRSSISHILSGRNKPSLDFVMKILNAYPEVELYWLLNGKGSFPKSTTPTLEARSQKQEDIQPQKILSFPESDIPKNISSQENDPEKSNSSAIERIVIFYKDGSFKNYEH
jgi:transcriptional regulator with XRE-family HTH domain